MATVWRVEWGARAPVSPEHCPHWRGEAGPGEAGVGPVDLALLWGCPLEASRKKGHSGSPQII